MNNLQRSLAGVGMGLVGGVLLAWWLLSGFDAHPQDEVAPLSRASAEPVTRPAEPPLVREAMPAPAASPAPLDRVETKTPVADLPTEAPQYFVSGSVVDRAGSPVKSFEVRLESFERSATKGGRLRESGSYTLRAPGAGPFDLVCKAPGFMTQRRSVDLAPGSYHTQVDFELEPTIALIVFLMATNRETMVDALARQGVARDWSDRVVIVASRDEPGGRWPSPQRTPDLIQMRQGSGRRVTRPSSNSGGMDLEFHSIVELLAPPPLYVSAVLGDVVIGASYVGDATAEVEVECELVIAPRAVRDCLGRIAMRIVDAVTTRPIASMRVRGRAIGEWGVSDALTNQDGMATLRDQAPGRLAIEVFGLHYARWQREVELAPGESLDLGTIALDEGMVLRGEILDPDGRPARECSVSLIPLLEMSTSASSTDLSVKTSNNGAFQMPGVGSGRYTLVVNAQGCAAAGMIVDTTSGPPASLKIALRRGTKIDFDLRGELRGIGRITVTDSNDVVVAWWPFMLEPRAKTILVPGRYTVTARDQSGQVRRSLPLLVTTTSSTVILEP